MAFAVHSDVFQAPVSKSLPLEVLRSPIGLPKTVLTLFRFVNSFKIYLKCIYRIIFQIRGGINDIKLTEEEADRQRPAGEGQGMRKLEGRHDTLEIAGRIGEGVEVSFFVIINVFM